jgi:hypothetical protein
MPITKITDYRIADAINRRFFLAIDRLCDFKLISALDSFCSLHELSAPRYREMRLTYGVAPKPGRVSRYKYVEVEAIYWLVNDYPVSSNWLLTGRGEMLTKPIK